MAYLRGDHYIWSDGERLHIWVFNGADHWEDSGWAAELDGKRRGDRQAASGTSIPQPVIDDYVVMRLAELMDEGRVSQTIERALQHGNFGGESLKERAEA